MSKQIYIDYDNENLEKFLENYTEISKMLSNLLDIKLKIKDIYRTVNGFHIYISAEIPFKLKRKELFLLLNTLELLLESDKKRAIFNILRILKLKTKRYDNISVLFQESEIKKVKKARLK